MNWLALLLAPLLILLTVTVCAQTHRNFPDNSKPGMLTAISFPQFTIDRQTLIMGAGGQIRGMDNLLILPQMVSQTGPVRYQLDIMGNLHRIWYLTPEEANQAQQAMPYIPR